MYVVLSFSYKNLNIALREKIAFPQEEIKIFYSSLFKNFPQIQECILLSTCNRFELIMFADSDDLGNLIEFIAHFRNLSSQELQDGSQFFYHNQAIEHIFSVASSLDSLVIGETQITGQLKNAYKTSYDLGYCKKELTRAMHFAFKSAALIRSQTQISKNPTSISSVAVTRFLRLNPQNKQVAVVGTGEIGVLCVKYLLNHGFEVLLLSRTIQHAQQIKDEINNDQVQISSFANLAKVINSVPYLFCATGAPHTIITQDMIKECDFKRIWFDLALPRDIEHFQRDDISLFIIDDLQEVVMQNKEKRTDELFRAQEIVQEQVCAFYQWLQSLDVEPIIRAFRNKAKQCCVNEVTRAIKKGFLSQDQEEATLKILHNAFNKFLHHPTTYIKTIKENPESDFVIENIKKLFDLNGEEIFSNPYKCEKTTLKDSSHEDE